MAHSDKLRMAYFCFSWHTFCLLLNRFKGISKTRLHCMKSIHS